MSNDQPSVTSNSQNLQSPTNFESASQSPSEEKTSEKTDLPEKLTIQSCLDAFFASETVEWECPKEKKVASETDDLSDFKTPEKEDAHQAMARNVSFSGRFWNKFQPWI